MSGLPDSRSRFEASAPPNTKLGAAKRAASNIDYCSGSRQFRAVPTFLNFISLAHSTRSRTTVRCQRERFRMVRAVRTALRGVIARWPTARFGANLSRDL